MKISDIVLMSDVDGTLLKDYGDIPQKNIEAIHRFVGKGGMFGLATGRSVKYTRMVAKELPINFPCVIYNGSAVYDFEQDKIIMPHYLPETAKDFLITLMENFRNVRYIIATEESHYDVTPEEFENAPMTYLNPYIMTKTLNEMPTDNWFKIVMNFDSNMMEEMKFFCETHAPQFHFVRSYVDLFEIIPRGVNKATAISGLMEQKGINHDHVACIGDYYNDAEMLKAAAISAAPQSAPEDIQALVQMIVCKCEDGAVADFIGRLEEMCDG